MLELARNLRIAGISAALMFLGSLLWVVLIGPAIPLPAAPPLTQNPR